MNFQDALIDELQKLAQPTTFFFVHANGTYGGMINGKPVEGISPELFHQHFPEVAADYKAALAEARRKKK